MHGGHCSLVSPMNAWVAFGGVVGGGCSADGRPTFSISRVTRGRWVTSSHKGKGKGGVHELVSLVRSRGGVSRGGQEGAGREEEVAATRGAERAGGQRKESHE